MHLLHDIISNSPEDVIKNFTDLGNKTYTSVCFSPIIPTSNNEQLNTKIERVNKAVNKMITAVLKADKEWKNTVSLTVMTQSHGLTRRHQMV